MGLRKYFFYIQNYFWGIIFLPLIFILNSCNDAAVVKINSVSNNPPPITIDDASHSTITGTTNIVANGVSTSVITITIKDSNENPQEGIVPTFTATGSGNNYSTCSASDAAGVSLCTLSSTVAETKTLTLEVSNTTPATVITGDTVTFVAPIISSAYSSIVASGPVLANNNSLSTVTITLRDQTDSAFIPGSIPTFSSSGSNNTINSCVSSFIAGVYLCSMKSSTPEFKTLTLSSPVAAVTGIAHFISIGPSAIHSSIAATSPKEANNIETSDITITIKDSDGYPITGYDPSTELTVDGTQNTLSTCSPSDINGESNCTLASLKDETKTLSWTLSGTGSVLTTNVTFTPMTFRMKWDLSLTGTSGLNTITLPLVIGETYNMQVDWGDGTSSTVTALANATHTYSSSGIYLVKVSGTFSRFKFSYDPLRLIEITQWGPNQWTSTAEMFKGCANLDISATDIPDFSQNISMQSMFEGNSNLIGNSTFNDWDTSQVTSMQATFKNAILFNQNIKKWNTRNVITMREMFYGASTFDQYIGSWETDKLENLYRTFYNATSFNQNISTDGTKWNTKFVTNMAWTFYGASNFNNGGAHDYTVPGSNPLNWDTAAVEGDPLDSANYPYRGMAYMFALASKFNQTLNFSNLSKVISMSSMFNGASNFNNGCAHTDSSSCPINWASSSSKTMSYMFSNAVNFNQPLTLNTSNVLYMNAMFEDATKFNQSLSSFQTSNVTSMGSMFERAEAFNQDINHFDVSSVMNFGLMFYGTDNFNNGQAPNLSGKPLTWTTSAATNMEKMFGYALSFNQPLPNFTTSNVTTMREMFLYASKFNQDISSWDTSQVKYMNGMFQGASAFNQNIGAWNTEEVINMANMFNGATSFNQDIDTGVVTSSWDVSKVLNMAGMFWGAVMFNQPLSNWNTLNVRSMENMFRAASAFDQDISGWVISKVAAYSNFSLAANAGWTGIEKPSFSPNIHKRVFVTSSSYTGNLGGEAGADAKCMSDSNYPGSGVFKAFLGSGNRSALPAVDWVLQPHTDYFRSSDMNYILTTDAQATFSEIVSDFASGTIYIWGGLEQNFTNAATHCSNWTSNANVNTRLFLPDSWTVATDSCNELKRLLCIEQ